MRLPRPELVFLAAAVLLIIVPASSVRAVAMVQPIGGSTDRAERINVPGCASVNAIALVSAAANESAGPNTRPQFSTLVLLAFVAILSISLAAIAIVRRQALAEAATAVARQLGRMPTTLESGGSYVLAGQDPAPAYGILSSYVSAGAKGLVLSRRYPDDVRTRHPVGSSAVLWLSRGYSRSAVDPANLARLVNEIEKHVAGREASVVLLDNLEYLVTQNGAPAVSKFLEHLTEAVAAHHSRLLVPLDPSSVPASDFSLLARDLRRL